ncbi:MAG: ATP-binding protein [Oligoflexia bacterium]|nr:ATP-binding protein [Oligoflexia bacterium]
MKSKNVRVFLLDDDEDDYIMIRDLLNEIKELQCSLEWESSYDKALKIMEKQIHDIYLLDFRLGAHSGLDVLDEAHNQNWMRPIIILTGFGDHNIDVEAMKRGASDYLVKSEITVPLLERSIRYSIKGAEDLITVREREAQIVIQDRLASIGLLASGLAHEIGTPLGIIRGRSEMLAKQLSGEVTDSAPLKSSADIIVSQIDRISKLIKSLLNLARGGQSTEVASVLLSPVVKDVIELLNHEFLKNKIEVRNNVTLDEVFVKANSGALHQVILNLLVNAVHAIEAKAQEGRSSSHFIEIALRDSTDMAVLSIKDSGCGITKENMKNIFKPFFTTKDVGIGTGLGLATSYRIVVEWGGEIKVESQPGIGTTFKIFLPKH